MFQKFILVVSMFIVLVSGTANANLAAQLKNELVVSLKATKTPGAVFLLSSPQLGTLSVAAGDADIATHQVMQTSNNFRIASMSKTFLAVAILKLAEQGVLNLDDKIKNLLPKTIEINRIANGSELTVRQLLEMRSGIANYIEYDAYADLVEEKKDNGKWTPEECIAVIYDEKPNFVAGKGYEYSNTNYLLLQLIVENLTHKPYGQVIREQILTPLNLNHTFIEGQGNGPNGVLNTHGYEWVENVMTDVTHINDGFGLADGGIISTAEDLKAFVQALFMNKTLLNSASLEQMLDFKGDDAYGLGVYSEEEDGEEAWSHNGSSSGFSGQYFYFPKQQLTLVLLTNIFDSDIFEGFISKVLQDL